MLIKEAKLITGGLSNTTKMPCRSFNTSALDCGRGSKLRGIENSVCTDCYACKGNYMWPNVQEAIEARLGKSYDPNWIEAMVTLIGKQSKDFFRWFDSGDIHSIEQLQSILDVCELTPNTKHWLPTREKAILLSVTSGIVVPENTCIRVSADFIDYPPPQIGFPTSTVTRNRDLADCHVSLIEENKNCGDCRLCWDNDITNIGYLKH